MELLVYDPAKSCAGRSGKDHRYSRRTTFDTLGDSSLVGALRLPPRPDRHDCPHPCWRQLEYDHDPTRRVGNLQQSCLGPGTLSNMKLIEIPEFGKVPDDFLQHEMVRAAVDVTVDLYRRVGFVRPWIGYLSIKARVPVGMCGFKSSPVAGRVEIAYGTVPGHEGQGIATAMATALIEIAQQENSSLTVFAQTLAEENASTSILKKLGFTLLGAVEHPEDGTVWEWELH